MKQIVTSLLGISLLAFTTVSCSKEGQDEIRQQAREQAAAPQVITANVSAGQTYIYNLGTGTTAIIKTQAQHHELSQIATASNGTTVYKYTAAKGYAGSDAVTLQQALSATSGGDGCYGNDNYNSGQTKTAYKTIAIKLNVAN